MLEGGFCSAKEALLRYTALVKEALTQWMGNHSLIGCACILGYVGPRR